MGRTPHLGWWRVGLLLVLLLAAVASLRAAPLPTVAWAQAPDETPDAEPTAGPEPTATPSDAPEPTPAPASVAPAPAPATPTPPPAPGTLTATPGAAPGSPPSPTPTPAAVVPPTSTPSPGAPSETPAGADSPQPVGGEGLVRLPEGEGTDTAALAAAGSRMICGETVTAVPYALPNWFDGTAVIGGTGSFLGRISPSEVDADSIMNQSGSYGSSSSPTSIFNPDGQYGSLTFYVTSACNDTATSSVPNIVWNSMIIYELTTNETVTPRIDPRDLVSAVLYWQTLVAPPVPTATPTVAPGTGGQTTLLSQPQRVVDTRPEYGYGFQGAGQPLIGYSTPRCYFVAGRVGVPADATGVLANVAIIGAPSTGHLIIWPAGQPQPVTANMNYNAGVPALSNMVTVRLGTGGQVCVVGAPGLNVAIDIAAYIR